MKSLKLTLTEDEAIALTMLAKAGEGGGTVHEALYSIVRRLEEQHPRLDALQRLRWKELGMPYFDLDELRNAQATWANPKQLEEAAVN